MGTTSKATKQSKNSSRVLFFEVLTLGTPRGRLLVFIPVLALLAALPVSFLERTLPQFSICARVLGERCYSVGITRGVSSLLKGNLDAALTYNWLSIPVLVVMVAIVAVDVWRFFILRKSKNRHNLF